MNYNYLRPGIGNAASYQAAGIPWYTSSLAPALSTTSVVVNLPQVTKFVTIKNTSTTGDNLRFTFNNDSVVDNDNYVLLESGESFSADFRVTDIHLISDSETPVPFTIVNGLTNIRRQEMTSTTPVPPNLLAWVQKQKLIADDPDGSPEDDNFGYYALTFSSNSEKLFVSAIFDEVFPGGLFVGSVYYFENTQSGYQQKQKIVFPDAANFQTAGSRMDYCDQKDALAIGGLLDSTVRIFQSSSVGYQQVQKLTASFDTTGTPESNPTSGNFGFGGINFSQTGDVLVIARSGDSENGTDSGAVYIFNSSSLGYQQIQKLTASGDADPSYDEFGRSTALSSDGKIIIVGAANDEENGGTNNQFEGAGSAYVFVSSSAGYQQVQKLTASGTPSPEGDQFGQEIAMSADGSIVAISSPLGDISGSFSGQVYIFQSSSVGYQQTQILAANDPDGSPEEDKFGDSISLSSAGDVLVVGSPNDEQLGPFAGAAYIFVNSGAGFQQVKKITAEDDLDTSINYFGDALAINEQGNIVAIGAWGNDENGTNAGAAYVFKYTRDY